MFRAMRLILVSLLAALASGGCATVSKQSPVMKASKAEFTVDADSMRIRARSLVGPFGAYIEESGDTILARADDPEVRKQALIWKADGLPAVREALFRADPLVALLDTWALTEQLKDYFESGPGRHRLREWADVAYDAAVQMQEDIVSVLASIVATENLATGERFVGDWAAANPISQSIAGRESILREATSFKTKSGTGGLKVVGSLAATMDDMLRQIEAYTANIPKQARWEAQLAVLETVGAENLARSVDLLPVVLEAAEELAGSADELVPLVTREREAVLDALRRERLESLAFLRQERLDTLERVAAERVAVLKETDRMRAAVLEAIHAEVVAVSELVRQERARTMEEAESIAGRTLGGAFEHAVELVDHIFLRVVLVLLLVFVGCVLLVLLASRLFRRRSATA